MADLVRPGSAWCEAFQHCFAILDGKAPQGTLCLCGERVLDRNFELPCLWLMAAGVAVVVGS
jgi:hypothetical protein